MHDQNAAKRLPRWYQRMPLMPKMLILTVAVGALSFLAIDWMQSRQLNVLFEDILRRQLSHQADEDRVRFDTYVETYHEAAALIASRKQLQDHVGDGRVFAAETRPLIVHRELPVWLPDASVLRHMVRIQNALLLDGKGRVRELYRDGPDEIPDGLLTPSARLLALSANQSAMITLDRLPYVVTSRVAASSGGNARAILLIASELDEDFLNAAQGGASEERLVAILAGERPAVVTSSRPDVIPPGALLDDLRKEYLVIGKSFFDSGSSELMMQYASFVPRSQFRETLGSIRSADRKQRIAMAILLIGASMLVVYAVTRAVQQLAERVVDISENELGMESRAVPRGDQLFVLKSLFQRFTNEVVESRKRLRLQAEASLRASEAKYQLLHESMRDAFVSLDMNGRIVDFNRAYQELLGYAREELLGRSSGDLTPRKWREPEERIIREEVIPFGHSEVYEKEYFRKDGTVFPVELRTFLLKDETGTATGMWAIVRDITGRKEAERELLVKERAMAAALTGIALADFEGKLTYANDAFLRLWREEKAADVLGRSALEFWERPDEAAAVIAVLERSGAWSGELKGKRRDGTRFDVQLSANLVRDGEGNPICMMSSFIDITERKKFLRQLEESEGKFRAVFDRAHDGILVADAETGRFLMANAKACELLGYDRDELLNLGVANIHPAEALAAVQQKFADIVAGVTTLTEDLPVLRKDGVIFYADISAAPVELHGRLYAIGIFRDITERKETAARLQELDRRQKAILNNIPDMAWLKDRESRFLAVNEPFAAACGRTADTLIGKTDLDIWPKELADRYRSDDRSVMESGTRKQVEEPLVDRNGRNRWIETIKTPIMNHRGDVVGTTGIARDVTERMLAHERIEASLREKETLLREIHHRVKNNLQVISSLLYFQTKKVTEPEGLAALKEGQDRLKSMILVHEKLYRSEDLARVDFGDYVRSLTDQMLQSYGAIRNRVAVAVEVGDIHLPIEIALPCGMIINELLTNVFKYAFPGDRGGSASVRVASTGGELAVEVRDGGTGLPAGMNAADPSTFGLQLVKQLTAQLGGRAVIESDSGAGTSARIVVPLENDKDRSDA